MARTIFGVDSTPPTVVVTVTPPAAQLTLAPGVPTVAATVDGAPATITAWAWSVTGPASYADDTIAAPTLTPTAGGTLGLACGVTIGGVVYRSAVVEWVIGVTDAAGKRWHREWLFQPADLADHDLVAGALTVDGVEVRNGSEGAVASVAIASGVLTVDTNPAGAIGGIWIYPVEAAASTASRDVMWIAGLGAEITADNDGLFLQYSKNGGTPFGSIEARRDGGVQKMNIIRAGANTTRNTSGGAQGRVIAIHMTAQRHAFRPQYRTTAWSSGGPTPADTWLLAGGTASGWHIASDLAPSASADSFVPDNAVGSSPDELVLKCRANNGRAYTLPGLALWIAAP